MVIWASQLNRSLSISRTPDACSFQKIFPIHLCARSLYFEGAISFCSFFSIRDYVHVLSCFHLVLILTPTLQSTSSCSCCFDVFVRRHQRQSMHTFCKCNDYIVSYKISRHRISNEQTSALLIVLKMELHEIAVCLFLCFWQWTNFRAFAKQRKICPFYSEH